ncbi:MAG: DegV family protein [Eubacterium sp.]|nr:DegV family protein [Eubacterium sp.]
MRKFAVFTDSTCNLTREEMQWVGIQEIIPFHIYINDKEYLASGDWESISAKEYYETIKNGATMRSSNATVAQYEKAFRVVLEQGMDVLSISCTAVLSRSFHESVAAAKRLQEEFPEAKIICIDSHGCQYSMSLLIEEACRQRDEGRNIEEVSEWVEKEKQCFNEVGTVERLSYLRKAGRISASAAFFGGAFSIKPIIVYDEVGNNVAIEKVRGRKASMERSAELCAEYIRPEKFSKVGIAHADCLEEAKQLGEMIRRKCKEKGHTAELSFHYGYVESGVGSSVGPGTLIVGFYGKPELRSLHNKKG